ncbi:MAG: hypothetical protein GC161_08400 [Planctomycetaceae bacterium]|nr:hypothetical protein [Planctomycetaceae bacterium]
MKRRVLSFATAVFGATALSASVHAQSTLDVVDTLVGDPNFSTLVTAIQTVDAAGVVPGGIVNTLKGPGPFTVFAPDNAAFAALPDGVLPSLLADPDALANVLLYHVLPGQFASTEVLLGGKEATLQGGKVAFSTNRGNAFVNSSKILAVDNFASNGVVHTIASVLSPADAPNTIVDALDGNPSFSILSAAIDIAGLRATLDGPGPFTLLAPTNSAFLALPQGVLRSLVNDPAALANVLTYHVIPGAVPASTVVTLASAATVQGNSIFINPTPFGLYLDQASVLQTDVLVDNGVIHVIDGVLDPKPTTLVDFVAANPSFTTLTTAVGVAGLGNTLAGAGPFTLFAPTNRAFDRLPAGVLDGLINDPAALSDVLLYHVVAGKLLASDVLALPGSATVLGPAISFSQSGNAVLINQSTLLAFDIELANGVLHVIDGVLVPPGS